MNSRARLYVRLLAAAVLASPALTTLASAQMASDHEHSHEQAGPAPKQLGRVSFANSCSPAVQASFERGVALLHSFWWTEGEKTFREVLAHDPQCAIATWGIATILINNPFGGGPTPAQAQQAMDAIALGRTIGAKTERERMFIDAIAQYYDHFAERPHIARLKSLADAFEKLAARFPADDEAQIFSAFYIAATQDPTEQTFASALRGAAILEVQFKKHPDHPGVAHYLIHAYDFPPIAARGLPAARRYAEIAPSAPHALHMPSHIFTRIGAWQDSVTSNIRSASVAKTEHEYVDQLHAMDYLEYAYLQLSQDTDARRVVEELPSVPGNDEIRAAPYAQAAIPARYVMERGAWKEAARLQQRDSPYPFTSAVTYFARAVGEARSGNPSAGDADVQKLLQIEESLRAAKSTYWSVEVQVERLGAAAWVAFAKGQRDAGLKLMSDAAALEDTSEKTSISPGRIVPAHELLGDMLLESGKPADAFAEYERAQVRDPNRFRSLYGAGQAAAQAGHRDKARDYYAKLLTVAGTGEARPETVTARQYLAAH